MSLIIFPTAYLFIAAIIFSDIGEAAPCCKPEDMLAM
jgi:hypothetical protein